MISAPRADYITPDKPPGNWSERSIRFASVGARLLGIETASSGIALDQLREAVGDESWQCELHKRLE
ncbi:MAG: hypothetical protein OXN96_12110 [Bryobacterales bacterium]|nr:hypothetical protein [Bryobacterales bacterium]